MIGKSVKLIEITINDILKRRLRTQQNYYIER